MSYTPCPKCYNYISEDRGDRGSQGIDTNGDPLPFWSDDPFLTPLGLAGDDYKGMTFIRHIHIQELREYYNSLEQSLGLTETSWTDDLTVEDTKFITKKVHIDELRKAIEILLVDRSLTIANYFALDRYGNTITTTQTDWTDVDRDNEESYPLLPTKTLIRAIHIEELRRGIYILSGFMETWTPSEVKSYVNFSDTLTSAGASPEWGAENVTGSEGVWKAGLGDTPNSFLLTTTLEHLMPTLAATGIYKQSIIDSGGNKYISIFLSSTLSSTFLSWEGYSQWAVAGHGGSFSLNHGLGIISDPYIDVVLDSDTVFKFNSIDCSVVGAEQWKETAWLKVTVDFYYRGYLEQVVLEESTKISEIFVQVAHPTYVDEVIGVYDNPEGTGINYFTGGSISDPRNGVIHLGTSFTSTTPYVTYNYRHGSYPINTVRSIYYRVESNINPSQETTGFYLSSFTNFNRNLWNDFNTLYGDPSTFKTKSINFKGFVHTSINPVSTSHSASITMKMDNIEIG